jgi:hypothetical protein
MSMKKITVSVVGTSPLLTDSPSLMQDDDSSPKARKTRPTPEQECEGAAYRLDGPGSPCCMPTVAFRQAMVRGGKGLKLAGAGRLGLNTILGASVFPASELTVLLDPATGDPLTTYVHDRRRVVHGGGAVMSSRPRFEAWAADIDLEYDTLQLSDQDVINAVDRAGITVGVGNYRPEKGGPYGRFQVGEIGRS